MSRFVEIEFVELNISVRARLLEEEMPRTCGALFGQRGCSASSYSY
jgi:hypothetical protein